MAKRSPGAGGLGESLRAFAKPRGIPLTPGQASRLERLDRWFTDWSRVLGLSGFRDAEERISRYFLEPLDAHRWIPDRAGEALDVGAGGGSPALPLAVVTPGLRWTLLEPNRRRAVFLEEALVQLGLPGARVQRVRLEAFLPEKPFVVITSRGVSLDEASLGRMASWLEPGGRLLLFTGRARSEALLAWRGSLRELARVALAPGFKGWLLVLERLERLERLEK
ncbi:MAG: 16S rRNA (guanine(527)-N(7))-methyltransferase RsmG, partial [Vicinamibacteria bacterium]